MNIGTLSLPSIRWIITIIITILVGLFTLLIYHFYKRLFKRIRIKGFSLGHLKWMAFYPESTFIIDYFIPLPDAIIRNNLIHSESITIIQDLKFNWDWYHFRLLISIGNITSFSTFKRKNLQNNDTDNNTKNWKSNNVKRSISISLLLKIINLIARLMSLEIKQISLSFTRDNSLFPLDKEADNHDHDHSHSHDNHDYDHGQINENSQTNNINSKSNLLILLQLNINNIRVLEGVGGPWSAKNPTITIQSICAHELHYKSNIESHRKEILRINYTTFDISKYSSESNFIVNLIGDHTGIVCEINPSWLLLISLMIVDEKGKGESRMTRKDQSNEDKDEIQIENNENDKSNQEEIIINQQYEEYLNFLSDKLDIIIKIPSILIKAKLPTFSIKTRRIEYCLLTIQNIKSNIKKINSKIFAQLQLERVSFGAESCLNFHSEAFTRIDNLMSRPSVESGKIYEIIHGNNFYFSNFYKKKTIKNNNDKLELDHNFEKEISSNKNHLINAEKIKINHSIDQNNNQNDNQSNSQNNEISLILSTLEKWKRSLIETNEPWNQREREQNIKDRKDSINDILMSIIDSSRSNIRAQLEFDESSMDQYCIPSQKILLIHADSIAFNVPFEYPLSQLFDGISHLVKIASNPFLKGGEFPISIQKFNIFSTDWYMGLTVNRVQFSIEDDPLECRINHAWSIRSKHVENRLKLEEMFWMEIKSKFPESFKKKEENDGQSDKIKEKKKYKMEMEMKNNSYDTIDSYDTIEDLLSLITNNDQIYQMYADLNNVYLEEIKREKRFLQREENDDSSPSSSLSPFPVSPLFSVTASNLDGILCWPFNHQNQNHDNLNHNNHQNHNNSLQEICLVLNAIEDSNSYTMKMIKEKFSLFLGSYIDLILDNVNIQVRNYILPLIHAPRLRANGLVFLVEEIGDSSSLYSILIHLIDIKNGNENSMTKKENSMTNIKVNEMGSMTIYRSAMPLKIFHCLNISGLPSCGSPSISSLSSLSAETNTETSEMNKGKIINNQSFQVAFSLLWDGAFVTMDRAFDMISGKSMIGGSYLPIWDKLRLIFRGNHTRIQIDKNLDLTIKCLTGSDLNGSSSLNEYLQLTISDGLVLSMEANNIFRLETGTMEIRMESLNSALLSLLLFENAELKTSFELIPLLRIPPAILTARLDMKNILGSKPISHALLKINSIENIEKLSRSSPTIPFTPSNSNSNPLFNNSTDPLVDSGKSMDCFELFRTRQLSLWFELTCPIIRSNQKDSQDAKNGKDGKDSNFLLNYYRELEKFIQRQFIGIVDSTVKRGNLHQSPFLTTIIKERLGGILNEIHIRVKIDLYNDRNWNARMITFNPINKSSFQGIKVEAGKTDLWFDFKKSSCKKKTFSHWNRYFSEQDYKDIIISIFSKEDNSYKCYPLLMAPRFFVMSLDELCFIGEAESLNVQIETLSRRVLEISLEIDNLTQSLGTVDPISQIEFMQTLRMEISVLLEEKEYIEDYLSNAHERSMENSAKIDHYIIHGSKLLWHENIRDITFSLIDHQVQSWKIETSSGRSAIKLLDRIAASLNQTQLSRNTNKNNQDDKNDDYDESNDESQQSRQKSSPSKIKKKNSNREKMGKNGKRDKIKDYPPYENDNSDSNNNVIEAARKFYENLLIESNIQLTGDLSKDNNDSFPPLSTNSNGSDNNSGNIKNGNNSNNSSSFEITNDIPQVAPIDLRGRNLHVPRIINVNFTRPQICLLGTVNCDIEGSFIIRANKAYIQYGFIYEKLEEYLDNQNDIEKRLGERTRIILDQAQVNIAYKKDFPPNKWPSFYPSEYLLTKETETKYFYNLSEKINISVIYDIVNPIYDNTGILSRWLGRVAANDRGDHININVSNITFMSDSDQYKIVYDVITNLLVYRDANQRMRAKQLETLVMASEIFDLASIKQLVQENQIKIAKMEKFLLDFCQRKRGKNVYFNNLAMNSFSNPSNSSNLSSPSSPSSINSIPLSHIQEWTRVLSEWMELRDQTALIVSAMREARSSAEKLTKKQTRLALSIKIKHLEWKLEERRKIATDNIKSSISLYPSNLFHSSSTSSSNSNSNSTIICDIIIKGIEEDWTSEEDGAVINLLLIESILINNCLSKAYYPRLIGPVPNDKLAQMVAQAGNMASIGFKVSDSIIRFYWKSLLPNKDGILIVEHAELNLGSLQIQIELEIASKIIKFFFPDSSNSNSNPPLSSSTFNERKGKDAKAIRQSHGKKNQSPQFNAQRSFPSSSNQSFNPNDSPEKHASFLIQNQHAQTLSSSPSSHQDSPIKTGTRDNGNISPFSSTTASLHSHPSHPPPTSSSASSLNILSGFNTKSLSKKASMDEIIMEKTIKAQTCSFVYIRVPMSQHLISYKVIFHFSFIPFQIHALFKISNSCIMLYSHFIFHSFQFNIQFHSCF